MDSTNRILDAKSIRLNYDAEDWEDAVRESGRLLVKAELVDEQYIEALVEMVYQYSAYMLVATGIAMPHSHSNKGVRKTGISYLKLSHPVIFPKKESNPVELLIAVAAENDNSHIAAISKVAAILSDEESMEALKRCSDPEVIFSILNDSGHPESEVTYDGIQA